MGVIVISGSSGTVGRSVVGVLRSEGFRVRALTRAGGVRPDEVSFSFTDPITWPAAFAGAETLFLMRPPQIGNVRRDLLPAVAAAARSGVGRVVFLSVLEAEHNPLLPHRVVEKWLDRSGLRITHLRAGNFMQNLMTVHGADIRDRGVLTVPAGNARMSYVDARDVGAVAARCLVEDRFSGSAYDLTGPSAITHAEVAAILSAVLGRPIAYTHPSLPRYWRHAARVGMAMPTTVVTSVLYTLARFGVGSRVTDDIERILGRSPTDFEQFVVDHRAVWSLAEEPPR